MLAKLRTDTFQQNLPNGKVGEKLCRNVSRANTSAVGCEDLRRPIHQFTPVEAHMKKPPIFNWPPRGTIGACRARHRLEKQQCAPCPNAIGRLRPAPARSLSIPTGPKRVLGRLSYLSAPCRAQVAAPRRRHHRARPSRTFKRRQPAANSAEDHGRPPRARDARAGLHGARAPIPRPRARRACHCTRPCASPTPSADLRICAGAWCVAHDAPAWSAVRTVHK